MNSKQIPVISIGHLHQPETLQRLDLACRHWGFFQVVDHGIPAPVIRDLREQMHHLFALPRADKRSLSRTATNPWGFYDRELTKNTRDWKEIYDYGPADGNQLIPQWPQALPGFRPAVTAYYSACEKLAFRLLSAIAVNLGMAANDLDRFFQQHSSFLRLNYYPRCPRPARPEGVAVPTSGHLGINHHTDAGALTLLWQDRQPGLEVFREDNWHLVAPHADALVVNIGDIVQVWSNDRYRAALHRVVANPARERYSAPFFFNPAYSANYQPLPSTTGAQNPARYRRINWGDFRARRAAGDYADHGEEVQIGHYRTETTGR